jgi:hypothetical protein
MTIPVVVPPDPVPIMNPRPDTYALSLSNATTLFDENLEIITDTNGAPIQGTNTGEINLPSAPFAGFVMLRADGGGAMQFVQVRDDAYAVTTTGQPQVQIGAHGIPVFSSTPKTGPNYGYNDQNNLARVPGQLPSQNAFPVVFEVDD